jgi:hypothetical protein
MPEITREEKVGHWILHIELLHGVLREAFDAGNYAKVRSGFEHIANSFSQIAVPEARELEEAKEAGLLFRKPREESE